MKRILLALLALLLAAPAVAGERPVLTVYTYSSFVADWGPGKAIAEAFETACECRLEYVAVDDGVTLLNRLRLEGESTRADVVLGLDLNLIAEARATGLFEPHGVQPDLDLPVDWNDPWFLPFDYGHFAFVYDSEALESPPGSLRELVDDTSGPRLLLQDPRTSTPGLGLLLWIKQVFGDDADAAWARLRPRVVTVTRGWSEAYGLFLKGEAPMVLSYTTSPAYHLIVEEQDRYRAALFEEGHYLQVEVGGRLRTSTNPELADAFLRFMVSPDFQRHIPTGNWMFPVIDLVEALPPEFQDLPQPRISLLYAPEEVAAHRAQWLAEWLDAMSR